jgi:hypothetical protein
MNSEKITIITEPGIYLFANPKKVSISLKEKLVFTLHSLSSSSTGILVQSPDEHRGDFLTKLDTLWNKYSSLSDFDSGSIQCKIFGRGEKYTSLLISLKSWLERHQVPVVASNVGKFIPEQVMVDCSSGKVGIQYLSPSSQDRSLLITEGTARLRNPGSAIHAEVLVLSTVRVSRTLAKQCIEEEPNWQAACPSSFESDFKQYIKEGNRWSVALIFDEMRNHKDLASWMKQLNEKNPSIQFRWVGAELPKLDENIELKLVPPLDPILLPEFKKKLRQAIFDSELSTTSETLTFPTKRKAK